MLVADLKFSSAVPFTTHEDMTTIIFKEDAMSISTLSNHLNNQAALSALTMGTQASRNKGKQGNDPMRALSGAIALQGGEEDGAMSQRLQQMKESVQALGGTQNSKEARKQAAIKKVEQLSQRAKQLEQMLQKGSPITGTFAKNTASELKSIARQLAAAVKDIRAAKDEGGGDSGGADLSAQATATAEAAAESAAGAAGANAEQAESGAEQAASDAESSASQAEQQATRAAEQAERAGAEAERAAVVHSDWSKSTFASEYDRHLKALAVN